MARRSKPKAISKLSPTARKRRPKGMTSARCTAIFERHGQWFIGYVPEVPGVNAQERTLGAARRALTAALEELAEIDPTALRGKGRRIEQIEVRVSA